MKREQIQRLKNEVKAPYEVIKRNIEDVYGNKYSYYQISRISNDNKNHYWAMNTDDDIDGNWAIKIGSECVKRASGLAEALSDLERYEAQ